MAERHVARCDWCGKEEELIATATSTAAWTQTTLRQHVPPLAYTFSLPAGWRNLDGATLCSWGCTARFADERAAPTEPGPGEA